MRVYKVYSRYVRNTCSPHCPNCSVSDRKKFYPLSQVPPSNLHVGPEAMCLVIALCVEHDGLLARVPHLEFALWNGQLEQSAFAFLLQGLTADITNPRRKKITIDAMNAWFVPKLSMDMQYNLMQSHLAELMDLDTTGRDDDGRQEHHSGAGSCQAVSYEDTSKARLKTHPHHNKHIHSFRGPGTQDPLAKKKSLFGSNKNPLLFSLTDNFLKNRITIPLAFKQFHGTFDAEDIRLHSADDWPSLPYVAHFEHALREEKAVKMMEASLHKKRKEITDAETGKVMEGNVDLTTTKNLYCAKYRRNP